MTFIYSSCPSLVARPLQKLRRKKPRYQAPTFNAVWKDGSAWMDRKEGHKGILCRKRYKHFVSLACKRIFLANLR